MEKQNRWETVLVPRRGLCADPDSCAVVSMCIMAMPVRVSAQVSVQEATQTFVQTVAEHQDFLVAPAPFWSVRRLDAQTGTA